MDRKTAIFYTRVRAFHMYARRIYYHHPPLKRSIEFIYMSVHRTASEANRSIPETIPEGITRGTLWDGPGPPLEGPGAWSIRVTYPISHKRAVDHK